jgi:hypothetical protein
MSYNKYYTKDSMDGWKHMICVDESDIEVDENGKESVTYWNGSNYEEIVLTDEYGNIEWNDDTELLGGMIAIDIRLVNTGKEVLYRLTDGTTALVVTSYYEPLTYTMYELPKGINTIDEAIAYMQPRC